MLTKTMTAWDANIQAKNGSTSVVVNIRRRNRPVQRKKAILRKSITVAFKTGISEREINVKEGAMLNGSWNERQTEQLSEGLE